MAIAFFSTWTTYGTWLPGDQRGWFKRGEGYQAPNPLREFEAALRMTERAITFDKEQRHLVEKTIADHCRIRKWLLHGVNCRSNHVHVVVTAPNRAIEVPREQFKAWCTRKLKERERPLLADGRIAVREDWWTERGWDEYIDDEKSLLEVIAYVCDGQELARFVNPPLVSPPRQQGNV
jgi:REP element-mobilizing transposase RayT